MEILVTYNKNLVSNLLVLEYKNKNIYILNLINNFITKINLCCSGNNI